MYKTSKIAQDKKNMLMLERDFMKNISLFCLAIVLFSIGIILGAELNSISQGQEIAEQAKKLDSLQDVVIQKVQAENKQKNQEKTIIEDTDNIKEVVATTTKISPYAKLTIEKFFKNCGHTTLDVIEIPKELVNMTKEELQSKYEKWEIKNFEEREIHLYREIEANCSSHFVVKENAGKVAVFSQLTSKNIQYKEDTNIDFESLREEDKMLIKEGVEIYGKEELSSFIEDFES